MDLQGIHLYFAYGSNLFSERMKKKYKSVFYLGAAYYPNFGLSFTRKSRSKRMKDGWVADMVFDPNSCVWGMVYYISSNDLLMLDKQEVVYLDDGYLRQKVVIFGSNDEEYVAWTYFVKVKGNGLPHPLYMKMILDGAQYHKLPRDYIDFLKSIRTLEV